MRVRSRSDTDEGPSRRLWTVSSVLLVVVIILGVLELIPANYYLFMPGQAVAVQPMIAIQGYKPLHHSGRLYLTDVQVYKVNHLLEEIYGRLNSADDLQPVQDVSGNLSESAYNRYNVQLMSDSIKQAEVAALGAITNYRPKFPKNGAEIAFVQPSVPAAKVLRTGDIIQSVNGHAVHSREELSPAVQAVKPGQPVDLLLLRGRRHLAIRVRTIGQKLRQGKRIISKTLIGIAVQNRVVLPPLPVKITISSGDIGGPSGGLMFALGVIQRLERRDITKGCDIAGTGTIDFAGNVGAIGGAKQKVIAAGRAGVRAFFVPNVPDNVIPAREHRGNIEIVPVSTLKQALQYLKRLRPCKPAH